MTTTTPVAPRTTRPADANGRHPASPEGRAASQPPSRPPSTPPARKRRAAWPLVVAAALVVGGLGVGGYTLLYAQNGTAAASADTVSVIRGPIVISVTESGTVKAAEQEVLKSEIEGQTTILYLIPEGRRVTRGELLVELDVSPKRDERVDRDIAVQNAEAAFIRATENLEVVRNQAQAEVAQAKLDAEFAVQDKEKFFKGDHPKQLKQANNDITIATEELRRAEERRAGSRRLMEAEFIARSEYDADALAEQKARLNLELAENASNLLKQFDYPRRVAELESNVEQRAMALERARRKASADVIQAEAELRARSAELDRQRERLRRIDEQIARAKIYASRDGLVVHATTGQGNWRGNQEPLQEGQQVRERQDLILLPTATDMIAETKIHESALRKVRVGMPVQVTVDALPGRRFWGEVERIAPLADAASQWMNPDLKVYNTVVRIHGSGEDLVTGMNCRAEIVAETHESVLQVPVQSVVRVGGKTVVYVLDREGNPAARDVQIGSDNNRMVIIESGVQEGERVMLNPPLGDTAIAGTLDLDDVPTNQREAAREAQNNPPVEPLDAEPGAGSGAGPGGMGGPPPRDTPQGPGGQGAGGQGPGGQGAGGPAAGGNMEAMRRAFTQVQARATEEERQRLTELRDAGDMAGLAEYGRELAQKYGIQTTGGRGEGQRGERGAEGQGERGGRPAEAAAPPAE